MSKQKKNLESEFSTKIKISFIIVSLDFFFLINNYINKCTDININKKDLSYFLFTFNIFYDIKINKY